MPGPRPSPRERGASSSEYALLAAGIAAVLVVAVYALGGSTNAMFTHTCDELEAHVASSCND